MATITTYDAKGAILAKFIFDSFADALTFAGNYELDSGNMRDDAIHRVSIVDESEVTK